MLNTPSSSKITVYSRAGELEGYAIRNFLTRTVVEFDWVELTCEADCREVLKLGRGLFYGAGAAEAPYCANEDVDVVGGGNSAG